MRIVAATFVYNERPYIPYMIDYLKSQGVEIFIIDNYSSDGTYEWLVENGIPCVRFDTDESFDLRVLQKELMRHIHRIKPDWFVYNSGADLYYIFEDSIRETIERADREGYNILSIPCYGALNTGEEFGVPLQNHYFIGMYWRNLNMIAKYDKDMFLKGDRIVVPNPKVYEVEGLMINYGACKPKAEMEEKLKRREKAWKNGLKRTTGQHFRKGKERNWVYSVSDGEDLRQSKAWWYIQRICQQ